MRWEGSHIDRAEVEKAVNVLQLPGEVFEVRIIGTSGKKEIISGYFRNTETLFKAFETIDLRGRNVYVTLGQVKPECFARSQCEHFEKNPPSTTSDTEIIRYRWLFIDLDPVRPAGISSSDEELKISFDLSKKVREYLQSIGFPAPVFAASGNGYHLLYRVDVLNDKEGRALIERCLKVLSAMFDNEKVKVDTTNSNPSRICKLHGTLAQKGTSTPDRPHRMSRIISVPEAVGVVSRTILECLAGELPEEPTHRKATTAPSAKTFELEEFLSDHGMTYSVDSNDRAKIYRLDACPFDHNHTNGDSKIFVYDNGAIAFKCHHNSCRGKTWQDVRLLFDPAAYDRELEHEQDDARIDAGYLEHVQKRDQMPAVEPETKKERKNRKLKTAEGLMHKDIPEPKVFIGIGDDLPLLVEGTCILSAKPKLGKSWLALAMCLAVAEGKDFLGYKTRQCSALYLDLETSEALQQRRLRKALNGAEPPKRFYLETETDRIGDGFLEQIEDYLKQDPEIGLIVVDVFQIIRTAAKSMKETEYEHAYRDITPLNDIAQKHHISIVLVCHDRKQVDADDPFSNILGSTGLQGAATQMIVMFRQRKDDPIHISVKGKTIDGLPELDVKLENAQWEIVDMATTAEKEAEMLMEEYKDSIIRTAVLEVLKTFPIWKGRCSGLINDAIEQGIPITDSAKTVGGFLHKHRGRFLGVDHVQMTIVDNGSGGKIYKIQKLTVDTVDEFQN